jgi:hypothetical protein
MASNEFNGALSIIWTIRSTKAAGGYMENYDATLKHKLHAVVAKGRAAQKAFEEAAKYWREVYSVQVPNTENQLVPGSLIGALDDTAIRLAGLAALISPQL